MGGSYSIQSDGVFAISTCQITKQTIITQQIIAIENECYINHVKTNCSELGPDIEHFRVGKNRYEINGVCHGVNDNRTVRDCINEIENKGMKE